MPDPKTKPKLLLLSAYDAKSHQHWRGLLQQELTEFDWTQIALPDRHFSWRVRGNSLSFASEYKHQLEQQYDGLIVTSMVDLAALRGFIPNLAQIPTLIYFHENQFDYPQSIKRVFDANRINAQITSIYSILCADQILFNSQYNLNTFFDGANKLLEKMPDGVTKGTLDEAYNKSRVLPVPINDKHWLVDNRSDQVNEKVSIVWNHRWEYDKQPEVFFKALKMLKQAGIEFDLHLLGQSFRKIPDCFLQAEKDLSNHIRTWGYQTRKVYDELLASADIVVSTAIHDFQGLSMLEAIASGCLPIAPNRVAYPEYIDQRDLYPISTQQPCLEAEAESLYQALKIKIDDLKTGQIGLKQRRQNANKVAPYACRSLIEQYRQRLLSLVNPPSI